MPYKAKVQTEEPWQRPCRKVTKLLFAHFTFVSIWHVTFFSENSHRLQENGSQADKFFSNHCQTLLSLSSPYKTWWKTDRSTSKYRQTTNSSRRVIFLFDLWSPVWTGRQTLRIRVNLQEHVQDQADDWNFHQNRVLTLSSDWTPPTKGVSMKNVILV